MHARSQQPENTVLPAMVIEPVFNDDKQRFLSFLSIASFPIYNFCHELIKRLMQFNFTPIEIYLFYLENQQHDAHL